MYIPFLVIRYLRARKITWFATAAVALSLAAVIVVMSVLWGLADDILRRARQGGVDVIVRSYSGYGITEYRQLMREIRTVEHVIGVAPELNTWGLIELGRDYIPAMIRGVDPETEVRLFETGPWEQENPLALLEEKGEFPPVVLGHALSGGLFVREGERMTLVAPVFSSPVSVAPTYPTVAKQSVVFRDTFHTDDWVSDQYGIWMPLADAQRFLRRHNPASVNRIKVMLDDPQASFAVKEEISGRFPTLQVSTWQEEGRAWYELQVQENRMMAIILSLILAATGFGILTILVMMVKEKVRDIGILRSLGGTPMGIASVFVGCGAAIGVLGCAVGLGVGLLAANHLPEIERFLRNIGIDIYFAAAYGFPELPSRPDPLGIAALTAFMLAVSVLASLVPAWKASRLDPVVTMREE